MTVNNNTFDTEQLGLVASDLRLLARLHDREVDEDFLAGLREGKVADYLSVSLETDEAKLACKSFDAAMDLFPKALNETILDGLAVEYANIYLCHNYRIAPTGSVWLTEEKLERQEPMFMVRDWYDKYGITVPDWRMRPDDHIAHELQFLAELCENNTEQSIADAAHFMDQCMLVWIPDFAQAVAERAHENFYIASTALTAAYLEELRDVIETISKIARPIPEVDEATRSRKDMATLYDIDVDRPFVPGMAESW